MVKYLISFFENVPSLSQKFKLIKLLSILNVLLSQKIFQFKKEVKIKYTFVLKLF
jgi:hypothetical protein